MQIKTIFQELCFLCGAAHCVDDDSPHWVRASANWKFQASQGNLWGVKKSSFEGQNRQHHEHKERLGRKTWRNRREHLENY